jgi:hypothetical protein
MDIMKNEKDIGLEDFIEEITAYAYFTTLKPDHKKGLSIQCQYNLWEVF